MYPCDANSVLAEKRFNILCSFRHRITNKNWNLLRPSDMILGADHLTLTSEGGGGGGVGWFWKKISCKCICIRKKFLHKTIVPKKIHARTVGWKKNSGKMFPELTHWTLSISRLLKDFSIFVAQYCVFLGCLYLYINSTCGFQYSYIFCWIQITAGAGT